MKKLKIVSVVILVAIATVILASCVRVHKLEGKATLTETLEKEGYVLSWSDEFDSERLDTSKWKSGYTSPARRGGYYLNDEETVFVSDDKDEVPGERRLRRGVVHGLAGERHLPYRTQ